MTSVAANRIHPTIRQAHNRETGDQRNTKSPAQQEKLLRTANLSNWKSDRADIQLMPSSCIDNYQDLVIRGNPVQLLPIESGLATRFATADAGATVSYTHLTLPTIYSV